MKLVYKFFGKIILIRMLRISVGCKTHSVNVTYRKINRYFSIIGLLRENYMKHNFPYLRDWRQKIKFETWCELFFYPRDEVITALKIQMSSTRGIRIF